MFKFYRYWVVGSEKPFICLKHHNWTKAFREDLDANCTEIISHYRVQLWSQCAFPRPAYMSHWHTVSGIVFFTIY